MAKTNVFRIQISLADFFTDYKAKAYVSVNRDWNNVRQLHHRIREIFDVNKFILTTFDGVYLPGKVDKCTFYASACA